MWDAISSMPPISEDSICQRGAMPFSNGEEANFEQLMVTMLDERDKLMDTIRDIQLKLSEGQTKIAQLEKERNLLNALVNSTIPKDYTCITQELNQTKEKLTERNEEIIELKAERSNTRLLLEHLECLVARHEKSLKVTVVKRQQDQAGTNGHNGVSSEVEVLKALKSLFEHHKALDEKVREKLRQALEKVNKLTENLKETREENERIMQWKASNTGTASEYSEQKKEYNEMKDQLEKQTGELLDARLKLQESNDKLAELDNSLKAARDELLTMRETRIRLENDLKECKAQKKDQDEKISTLENRYLFSKRETSSVSDLNAKLELELAGKESQVKVFEEKMRSMSEKLKLADQQIEQLQAEKREKDSNSIHRIVDSSKFEGLVDDDAKQVLNESISCLERQLREKNDEISRMKQRERMNEEHNQRLSETVDKLLEESTDRLHKHLEEQMAALEEKSSLNFEISKVRRLLDVTGEEKDKLQTQLNEAKDEVETLKLTIKRLELSQIKSQNSSKFDFQSNNYLDSLLLMQQLKDPLKSVDRDSPSKLVNNSSPILNMNDVTDIKATDDACVGSKFIMASSDTQTALANAIALQEKLDEINEQIRTIQEEKKCRNVQMKYHEHGLPYPEENSIAQLNKQDLVNLNTESFLNSTSLFRTGISPPQSGRSTPRNSLGEIPNLINAPKTSLGLNFQHYNSSQPNAQPQTSYFERMPSFNSANFDPSSWPSSENFKQHNSSSSYRIDDLYSTRHQIVGRKEDSFTNKDQNLRQTINDYSNSVGDQNMQNNRRSPLTNQSMLRQTPSLDSLSYSVDSNRPLSSCEMVYAVNVEQQNPVFYNYPQINYIDPQTGIPYSPMMQPIRAKKSKNLGMIKSALINRFLPSSYKREKTQINQQYTSNYAPVMLVPIASADSMKLGPFPTLGNYNSSIYDLSSHQIRSTSQSSIYEAVNPGFANQLIYSNQPLTQQQQQLSQKQYNAYSQTSRPDDVDRKTKEKQSLLIDVIQSGTPFAMWDGATIVAWLELWVGMPAWYVAACRANVKSGAIMSALNDSEMQRELHITNPLHRLKLRLATIEMVKLTEPSFEKRSATLKMGLSNGQMNHEWIGNEWLPSLGLPQYRSTFMECLVDGRMLEHLTKKDLRVHLKILDSFHRNSLRIGIKCLKKLNYNKQLLNDLRNKDNTVVWSNSRLIDWANSVNLQQFSQNLIESGTHGALIAMDDTFQSSHLASALQIPTQNVQARNILSKAYNDLLQSAINDLSKLDRLEQIGDVNISSDSQLKYDQGERK